MFLRTVGEPRAADLLVARQRHPLPTTTAHRAFCCPVPLSIASTSSEPSNSSAEHAHIGVVVGQKRSISKPHVGQVASASKAAFSTPFRACHIPAHLPPQVLPSCAVPAPIPNPPVATHRVPNHLPNTRTSPVRQSITRLIEHTTLTTRGDRASAGQQVHRSPHIEAGRRRPR